MPIKVTGTHGKQVVVEILGVREVIDMLEKKGKDMADGMNVAVAQAGALMKEETQESIAGHAGHRAEIRSVDTGEFINSIGIDLISRGVAKVYSDVPQAIFMEYGTSRGIEPRSHFRNSLARNKDNILKIIREHTADKV